MRKLPSLSALRAFEATARHLSMRRAADELSVTPTAISHQIRRLEDALGVTLFERQVRALRLSAAGERLYPVLNTGFNAFAQVIDAIRAPDPTPQRQRVTLTAPIGLAARWLVPRLGDFATQHPHIDLRIHASDFTAAAPIWPCVTASCPPAAPALWLSGCLRTPTHRSAIRV
jgi:LysR family glycine cleavage system transcriptional activator